MIHAICIQGKSHSLLKNECQDRIYIDQNKERRIISIADGMGSYTLSGDFAQYILPRISSWCRTNEKTIFTLTNDMIRNAIGEILNSIIDEFKKEFDSNDFGSTLIIIHQSFVYQKVVVMHVGDGAVLGVPKGNCQFATAISSPENYEHATISLENKAHMKILRFDYDDYSAFFAGTDGGMAPFINSDTNGFASTYVDYTIRKILKGETDLKNLIKQEHYDKCRIQDDISLVVLDFNQIPVVNEERGFIKILSPKSIESDDNILSTEQFSLEQKNWNEYENTILPINEQIKISKRTKKKNKNLSFYVICVICMLSCLFSVSASFWATKEMQKFKQEYTEINEYVDNLNKELNDLIVQQEQILNDQANYIDKNVVDESSAPLQY